MSLTETSRYKVQYVHCAWCHSVMLCAFAPQCKCQGQFSQKKPAIGEVRKMEASGWGRRSALCRMRDESRTGMARKIGEVGSAGFTQGKTAQMLIKVQVKWLHLRLSRLDVVPEELDHDGYRVLIRVLPLQPSPCEKRKWKLIKSAI